METELWGAELDVLSIEREGVLIFLPDILLGDHLPDFLAFSIIVLHFLLM